MTNLILAIIICKSILYLIMHLLVGGGFIGWFEQGPICNLDWVDAH